MLKIITATILAVLAFDTPDPCLIDATDDRIVVDAWGNGEFTSAAFDSSCEGDEVTVVVGADETGALALDQIQWAPHGDTTVSLLEIDDGVEAEPVCNSQTQSCPPPTGCGNDQTCFSPCKEFTDKKCTIKVKKHPPHACPDTGVPCPG